MSRLRTGEGSAVPRLILQPILNQKGFSIFKDHAFTRKIEVRRRHTFACKQESSANPLFQYLSNRSEPGQGTHAFNISGIPRPACVITSKENMYVSAPPRVQSLTTATSPKTSSLLRTPEAPQRFAFTFVVPPSLHELIRNGPRNDMGLSPDQSRAKVWHASSASISSVKSNAETAPSSSVGLDWPQGKEIVRRCPRSE